MLEYIDNFLNKTTMYRLVLYYLVSLWLAAVILSFLGLLPYNAGSLILSAAFITAISWVTNNIFSRVYQTPTNLESVYITAFILVLIISPFHAGLGLSYLMFLAFVSVLAMASKYILAIRKKHIFNPAALAVAITALAVNQPAIWWIGNVYMLPIVLLGGILVVRKLKRNDLVISFLVAALAAVIVTGFSKGTDLLTSAGQMIIRSPLLFFAFVMLTEPLTTPPTRFWRVSYGVLTGFLFAPAIHLGSIYSTPELALLVGNIFSYIVSPKKKLLLTLVEKKRIASDTYDFVFASDQAMNFKPGQYLEWTSGHASPDNRGNRRYFTIASSPTEKEIRMGVKFYPQSSSFKKALLSMKIGDTIIASQLAGEFILPRDKERKLVFMAGGIGITPFRSMIKFLLDTHEDRDITILYSNKTKGEIAYKEIFDSARNELGVKIVYALTDKDTPSAPWYHAGRVDAQMIRSEMPDYQERMFYISGPRAMVVAYENILKDLGVGRGQIKTDFFPGFV